MRSIRTRELALLLLGDVFSLAFSLWLTLVLRSWALPSAYLLKLHFVPFSILFVVWILVFLIAGFYDPYTKIFRARLPERILRVQVLNMALAALLFFFVPVFGIAPKTNLVIYLIVSSVVIIAWRLVVFPWLLPGNRAQALLIGGGKEFSELKEEVNGNTRYPFYFADSICIDRLDGGALSERIFKSLRNLELSFIIVDTDNRKLEHILPHLYKPIFSNTEFIDLRDLYEEIFERMPISILGDDRALRRTALHLPHSLYEVLKRAVDAAGAIVLGIPTLLMLPFLILAVRLESQGPAFISQRRIGRDGKIFSAYKLRSMERMEYGVWIGETDNRITRVGSFLRRTRLDELPQLWNILRGDLSFVGPRPDLEGLAERLAAKIPFYDIRTTVAPGLSGWAQLKQDYEGKNLSPQSVEETKKRFMYDLYYIKHRSFMLDILIIVRTIRVILARSGS